MFSPLPYHPISAALSKWEFAERLGIKNISRYYTREDLDEDLMFANG